MTITTVIESPLGSHHSDSAILTWGIVALLAVGVVYTGVSLYDDLNSAPLQSALPYILLGIALLIALAFEMCNGFHDTSNAVATAEPCTLRTRWRHATADWAIATVAIGSRAMPRSWPAPSQWRE